MSQIIYFFLGVIVGAMAWQIIRGKMGSGDGRIGEENKPVDEVQDNSPGLIEKQAREKEEHKQKILDFFKTREEAANDDIEALLGVSNATAERYLDELEGEGHLAQIGKTGRSVYYKKT